MEIKGIDIVACVTVGASALLIYTGHNGGLITLLSTVVGYYFGRKSKEDN